MAQTQNEHLRCVEELYTETASLTGMAPESIALDDVPDWNDVQRMLGSGLATGPRQGMFTVNPGTPQRNTREASQKRARLERRIPEEQDAEDMEAAEKLMFMTMKREPTPEERPPSASGDEAATLGKRQSPYPVETSIRRLRLTTVHTTGNT